jgi:hypothetical protein
LLPRSHFSLALARGARRSMTYALPVVATSFACMAAWLGLALHDVVQQGKLHPAPCDADAVGRSSGAVGVTRCVRWR